MATKGKTKEMFDHINLLNTQVIRSLNCMYTQVQPVTVDKIDREAQLIGYTSHMLQWVGFIIVVLQKIEYTLA